MVRQILHILDSVDFVSFCDYDRRENKLLYEIVLFTKQKLPGENGKEKAKLLAVRLSS